MKDSRWWYHASWVMVVLYLICLIAFNISSSLGSIDDTIFWGFMTTILVVAVFGCIIVGVLMEQNESHKWASRKKSANLLENIEKRVEEIKTESGDHQSWPEDKGFPKGAE